MSKTRQKTRNWHAVNAQFRKADKFKSDRDYDRRQNKEAVEKQLEEELEEEPVEE